MIAVVVKEALEKAIAELPYGAMGVRCHALPLDDALDECVAGVAALLEAADLENAKCVIGSASTPSTSLPPRTAVLQSDLAAAEATRLRNDRAEVAKPKFRLIYLNSGSSPGEAGLEDVLFEIRAQALARHYADAAGLPLLAAVAQSRSRAIIARLEDTNVATLARYVAKARDAGELVALPILGFLPRSLNDARERPSPQWASDFDTMTSGKLIDKVAQGIQTIQGLNEEQRKALGSALSQSDGCLPSEISEHPDPIAALLTLARDAHRFALGYEQDPGTLCGLNRKLLDVIRDSETIRELATEPGDGDADADGDGDGEETDPARAVREEDVLGEEGIPGLLGAIQGVDLSASDGTPEALKLRRAGGDVITLAGEVPPTTLKVVQDAPELVSAGAAVHVAPEAAILAAVKPARFSVRYQPPATDSVGGALRAALDAFLAARRGLLAAVGARVPLEEDARYDAEQWGALLLEAFPLTAIANARAAAEAYVAAYVRVMELSFGAEFRAPDPIEKWLTHLDCAFTLDGRQRATAARLLPMHPLRVARSMMWLDGRAEPPPFPSVLVTMTARLQDSLVPHGERHAYHARLRVGPGRDGIVAAIRQGVDAAWSVLAPRGLMSALDVELIDIANNSVAIGALYAVVAERFAADATVGDGVHLRVRCAYSAENEGGDVTCPRVTDVPELAGVVNALPGTGVTVEILPLPCIAGAEPVHLSVQAIEAPFHSLAPSPPAGWHVRYIPGASGNIRAVELSGNPALDAYRRLLRAYHQDITAAFDPGIEVRGVDRALVKAFVARGGWPIKPTAEESILSYDVVGGHVTVTLADAAVFDAEIAARLSSVSTQGAETAADLSLLREGMIGLFPCRTFLADLLEGGDERHLRGWMGVLRAFRDAAQSNARDKQCLALSLDDPEGRAWIRAVKNLLGGDEQRADLILVEGDLASATVTKLRVVELKARTSSRELSSPAARAKLSRQALVTAARLRATLAGADGDWEPLREALRRFFWMGAGQQRAALLWQRVLDALDLALRDPRALDVEVSTECWLVPEEPWVGDAETLEPVTSMQPDGVQIAGETELVRFRILQPVAPPAGTEEGPGSAGPQGGAAGGAPVAAPQAQGASASAGRLATVPAAAQHGAPLAEIAPPAAPQVRRGSREGEEGERDTPAALEPPSPAAQAPTQGPVALPPLRTPAPVASPDGMKIVFGRMAQGGGDAIWLPNRTQLVTHFNVGITGTMGTGKTQFVKSLLAQIARSGGDNPGARTPGILIFDYKGDYIDTQPGGFAHAVGARVLSPHHLPINPMRLYRPATAIDLKLGTRQFAETIRTIARATGDVQRMGLIEAADECLRAFGISSDPASWDRPFPTVQDLYENLKESGAVEGSPLAAIHDLADLEIFAPKDPGVELDDFFDGVNVINLKHLGDQDKVKRAIISFFTNALYGRMLQQQSSIRETRRLPNGGTAELRQIRRLLLVDEADDFISMGLPSLKNVMQQGREFGYGVVLSTQFLHHFDGADSPLKPLIGTWILHRMPDVGATTLRNLFGISSDEAKGVANVLSGLEPHTSLCSGLSNEGRLKLTRVRDLPFFELMASKTP